MATRRRYLWLKKVSMGTQSWPLSAFLMSSVCFNSEVHLINVGDADAASSQEAIHLKSLLVASGCSRLQLPRQPVTCILIGSCFSCSPESWERLISTTSKHHQCLVLFSPLVPWSRWLLSAFFGLVVMCRCSFSVRLSRLSRICWLAKEVWSAPHLLCQNTKMALA